MFDFRHLAPHSMLYKIADAIRAVLMPKPTIEPICEGAGNFSFFTRGNGSKGKNRTPAPRSRGYNPYFKPPSPPKHHKRNSTETLILFLLLFFLPPVGIAMLWIEQRYTFRGRIVLTCVSFLMLTLLASVLFKGFDTRYTLPQASLIITSSPQLGNTTTDTPNPSQTPAITPTPAITSDPNTIVYSVRSGAINYHKNDVCLTQTNARQLTLQDAKDIGLVPCPDCDPPQ